MQSGRAHPGFPLPLMYGLHYGRLLMIVQGLSENEPKASRSQVNAAMNLKLMAQLIQLRGQLLHLCGSHGPRLNICHSCQPEFEAPVVLISYAVVFLEPLIHALHHLVKVCKLLGLHFSLLCCGPCCSDNLTLHPRWHQPTCCRRCLGHRITLPQRFRNPCQTTMALQVARQCLLAQFCEEVDVPVQKVIFLGRTSLVS